MMTPTSMVASLTARREDLFQCNLVEVLFVVDLTQSHLTQYWQALATLPEALLEELSRYVHLLMLLLFGILFYML